MTETIVAPSDVEPVEPVEPAAPPVQTMAQTVGRLIALVVGTAAGTGLIIWVGGWPWAVVIASLLTIIMLHELGHFVTAKWSGMKATEFFVGFGPRLWSIRRGETEYGIKAFPLGGYVKILGMTSLEELDPSDEPRSFVNQSTSKRVLVASAGSIVHFLIAFSLAMCAIFFIGWPQLTQKAGIAGLVQVAGKTSPAQAAGLHTNDVIVSINGVPTTYANLHHEIAAAGAAAMTIVVLRDGHDVTLVATPRKFDGSTTRILGIYPGQYRAITHPSAVSSVADSGVLVWQITDQTINDFASAFSPSGVTSLAHQVTNAKYAKQVQAQGNTPVSIIGALRLLADALKSGTYPFLGILISLNISLGILNMLPMLPLDGGHVAIALYERIRTRRGKARYRADVTKLMPVVYVFVAFLFLFVASKMYLDVAHGTSNPFG